MKSYSAISPSLEGILTDDYLYFEGTLRPSIVMAFRDGVEQGTESLLILEQYWNDMYNLFLRKLTSFASSAPTTDEENLKLQALLQELIKVKGLIENAGKTAIMRE